MLKTEVCPECGCELSGATAARGLCPKCLMRRAVAELEATPGSRRSVSTPRSRFVAPEPVELAPHFPQFEILELLGQGGMGAVYKARQRSLDRLVALKIIPASAVDDPAFVERFHREARTVAKLNHPNLVAAYDFGQVDQCCYFVMEYVDGPSLRELLAAHPLTPGEALCIAEQVCDALTYAHALGVVHRDIKPENILLEEAPAIVPPEAGSEGAEGRVKIADFGLAKLLEPEPSGFTLTTPEHVLGTPQYMAPEQIERPHEVDHRADIFGLGVVLYEMLSGELPLGRFEPVSRKARVDRRLDALVLRCLEKEPGRRHQQASQLKADLAEIRASLSAPARRPWRTGPLVAVGTVFLLAAVCLLAWQIVISLHDDGTVRIEVSRSEDAASGAGKSGASPADGSLPEKQKRAEQREEKRSAEGEEAAEPAPTADHEPAPAGEPLVGNRVSGEVTGPRLLIRRDAADAPEVLLSGAKLSGMGIRRSLRIDYKFQKGHVRAGARYFWVVESADGWVGESSLFWHNLGEEGTLRSTFYPHGFSRGPFETYLEMEEFGPFSGRRRISNIVKIGDEREENSAGTD